MTAKLVSFALAVSLCSAQSSRQNTYHANAATAAAAAPRLVSPELHPDRTITFRLRAPKASEVTLVFPGARRDMTKDADGLWTVTIGRVEPEIYAYSFTVDGARVLDTANGEIV